MNEVIFSRNFPAGYYCDPNRKDAFIHILGNHIRLAARLWDEKHKPEAIIRETEVFIKRYNTTRDSALKVAQKKWKTEKKQTEYVNAELAKYCEKNSKRIATGGNYHGIEYFDFDLQPGTNGINGVCILDVNATDEQLSKCYDYIKDNKYFKAAEGWQFEYDGSGRPQIKLILPKEMQQMYDEAKESLARAISKFYEGCTYFGD